MLAWHHDRDSDVQRTPRSVVVAVVAAVVVVVVPRIRTDWGQSTLVLRDTPVGIVRLRRRRIPVVVHTVPEWYVVSWETEIHTPVVGIVDTGQVVDVVGIEWGGVVV